MKFISKEQVKNFFSSLGNISSLGFLRKSDGKYYRSEYHQGNPASTRQPDDFMSSLILSCFKYLWRGAWLFVRSCTMAGRTPFPYLLTCTKDSQNPSACITARALQRVCTLLKRQWRSCSLVCSVQPWLSFLSASSHWYQCGKLLHAFPRPAVLTKATRQSLTLCSKPLILIFTVFVKVENECF